MCYRYILQASGMIIMYNTKEVYWNIIHWWLLCSLDKDCISPPGSTLKCVRNAFKMPFHFWNHCHRYDQSVINILAANYYNYNMYYYAGKTQVVDIKRQVTKFYNITYCNH